MNKWLKIILILAVIGIITAVLLYVFIYNKPHKDIESAKPDFTMKTEKLYQEFTSNKTHADSLYNEKVIEIAGKINKVETKDTLVIAVFVFSQGDFGDTGIRCTMLPKYNDEAKKLAIGSVVRIKGLCKGFIDDVILEKCSLINN
jgi:hypothetical protein